MRQELESIQEVNQKLKSDQARESDILNAKKLTMKKELEALMKLNQSNKQMQAKQKDLEGGIES